MNSLRYLYIAKCGIKIQSTVHFDPAFKNLQTYYCLKFNNYTKNILFYHRMLPV